MAIEETKENNEVNDKLHKNLEKNIKYIKDSLGNSPDIIVRQITIGENSYNNVAVLYNENMSDIHLIQNFILKTLMIDIRKVKLNTSLNKFKGLSEYIKQYSLPNGYIKEITDFNTLFLDLVSGDTIILLENEIKGLVINTRKWIERSITESSTQALIRGPKDSFTETINTNLSLLRRRIKDKNLWVEIKSIGKITQTNVAVVYLNHIVNNKIVEEVRRRLDRIDIDGILDSGNLEELIDDENYTTFPTIYNSDRPDAIAGGLLEGRIGIIVDGSPFVLLVPTLFINFFQSPEDYYQRFDSSILVRVIRFVSFFLALLTPSLYIAVTTFHQEMIPSSLLISIAAQREGVPFPAFVEALIMEITFEILREAGIRMPRAIGSAISIVGALVLGEAAVQAGIVSPVMVIVVAITAISSFVMPIFSLSISIRLLRFGYMILAATMGIYGIFIGLIIMILHLCSIRSFGVPYTAPMAPFNWGDQKDVILRLPLWLMKSRPHLISKKNINRQQSPSSAQPKPPNKS